MKQIFNLKSYATFLSRNKVYSAINVFGFSVSLMFVILLGVYVYQEFSVDKMHKKEARIVSVGLHIDNSDPMNGINQGIIKPVMKHFPEVEMGCGVTVQNATLKRENDERMNAKLILADSTFYQMFDFPLSFGDRNTVLSDPNSVVVSEEFGRKLFGDSNPVGQSFQLNDSVRVHVTGTYKSMEGSSIPPVDFVISHKLMRWFNEGLCSEYMNNACGTSVYLLEKEGTDLLAKCAEFDKLFKSIGFWIFNMPGTNTKTVLTPLNKLYFAGIADVGNNHFGNMLFVRILLGVCLVILLFSVFNYINLTVAQSSYRAKEMATRRLLGSQRSDIALRLIIESVALCLLSFVIAVVLAASAMPFASKLLNTELHFSTLLVPMNIMLCVGIVVVVGCLAGIIPAVVISRAKPIDVVRGTFRRRAKMTFSRVFIIFQNVITITLITSAITMSMQVRHLVNAPLGYDKYNLMAIWLPQNDSTSVATFLGELRKMPCVADASASWGHPLQRGNNSTFNYKGKTLSFQKFLADEHFFNTMGLKVERDNHIANENGLYLNHQAFRELGISENARSMPRIETFMQDENKLPVIRGIMQDFHIGDAMTPQGPVAIMIWKHLPNPWDVLVRVKGDNDEAFKQVNALYKKIFHLDIDTSNPVFMDQQVEKAYEHTIRQSSIVSLFAMVAVLISMLGLIAMSTYFIQQRRKEIAVRRVFGGSTNSILMHLVRSFMVYTLVAFIIAVPVAYYLMGEWLAGYSYRISVSPLVFLAAGAASAAISFVAVYFQSRRAANANPAVTIKENG